MSKIRSKNTKIESLVFGELGKRKNISKSITKNALEART